MADGTYLRGYHEYATRDVTADDIEVLVLDNSDTPVFNQDDATVADVLARSENVEATTAGYARTDVPSISDTDGTLDHGTVTMSVTAVETWSAVVYFRNVNDDDNESPVLFFKDIDHETASGDVTIDAHASDHLCDIVRTITHVVETDENTRKDGDVYADANFWETTHYALAVANAA